MTELWEFAQRYVFLCEEAATENALFGTANNRCDSRLF